MASPAKDNIWERIFSTMKSKKIASLILAASMLVSLAACSGPGKKTGDDDKTKETTEETTTEATTESETEETTTATERDGGIGDLPDPSDETSETSKATDATEASSESSESKADSGSTFTGKIIDFDDMHFFVNGKKYTLGKTTLQEMIDDVVPYNAKDIKNASAEIKKNSQSLNGFGIECDKFWSPSVYVMNLSSEAKPMSECVIYKFYMHSIEMNYKNGANISFDFPYKLSMEDLIANAGEPKNATDKVHDEGTNGNYSDTFRYRQKSTKYLGSREFSFYFKKGEISRITLTYIP